jgi:triosephosphate isomerase (TIM)
VHWEDKGAYTGEISPPMLAKLSVRYVIVGHSERRQLFGETDEIVARKVRAVLRAGMLPIVCVGETLDEREAGATTTVVTGQIVSALDSLGADAAGDVVVAYEPLWAIGSGRHATPEDVQVVCATLRSVVGEQHGAHAAASIRIQYGGSVQPGNVKELLSGPDVDGALVGGASLDAEKFAQIITYGRS